MTRKMDAVWDSRVPYKRIKVSPNIVENYMPDSIKNKVPLLISNNGNTTVAQLYIDDLTDNKAHLSPITAQTLEFSEPNNTESVEIEQTEVESVETITLQVSKEPTKRLNGKKSDIKEYLSKQMCGQFFVLGDTIVVPKNKAGKNISFSVVSYQPRSLGNTVAYVNEDTVIKVNFDELDNTNQENSVDVLSSQQKTMTQAQSTVVTESNEQKKEEITYDSIGGLTQEIKRVRELIERPLEDPEAFQGVPTPSGILLHGPPGTGKTMLARAVSNEVDASFYAISGSEIFEKNYGESEDNLRSLFSDASEDRPAIIFIDELESLIPPRDELSSSNQVERRVVTQLKTLMDGFSSEEKLIVLGATNHISEIDDAFLRPGRFDRQIEIGVPDANERREIIEIHTRSMKMKFGEDYMDELVCRTTGYTGADIEGLCLQANMAMQRRLSSEYPNYTGKTEISEILCREDEGYRPEDFDKALNETEPSLLKKFNIDVPKVQWEDIGGYSRIKQRLREQVDGPLKAPELWSEDEQSTGILLYGPPGTGKTSLAKAMATESNRVFIGVQATELRSKWVGETEEEIRRLFSLAENLQPSILYIDEIEAISQERNSSTTDGGVSNSSTSQLLSELDGIENRGDVIVVGSTNANYDPEIPLQQQEVKFGLDPALLRPGRLESHYHVGAPKKTDRKEIFQVHLNKVSEGSSVVLSDNIDIERLSKMTEGLSGADIESICWEAKHLARNTVIENAGGIEKVNSETITISQSNLEKATERYSENKKNKNPADRMYS